ncbi:LTA synthase family protein [Tenacibaculum maritimum]|uniref:LTA synthase family protein n=1 Tax=Tenacibaculum maritimum TaxID=107401 RepID=UPI00387655FB
MFQKIPNYTKYIFSNVFFLFLYIFLFRIIFYFFFAKLEDASTQEISNAFQLGARFDLKLAVLIILPLSFLIFIINYRFFKHSFYEKASNIYLTLAYITITLFYVFDFGYYDYLDIRLDASSLRFLSNFKISSQVLLESYPVFKGLFLLALLSFAFYKFSQWIYKKFSNHHESNSQKAKAFFIIIPLLLLAFGIYNSITHYPLRWSQAFFSKNNHVNQFSLNPILYFFDSFKFRSESFDLNKTKQFYPAIAKQLNLPKDTLLFERKFLKKSEIQTQPNIVIVMLESVGVVPMSYYNNPILTTPKMDSIIKKSINFSNFFVHKAGTAGSVFASITGLPDIDGVRTASRNPMIIDQRIIFDQFNNYEKLYFLGGSANWANIRGVFQSNITNLNIFEEGSYATENRADVWGIDDYELFKESNKELEKIHKKGKPFIAYIQTATNHMPFTVPEKKETFTPLSNKDISSKELKKAGFDGIERLNALRYLDFNVAKFLTRAQQSGYYDNTIFLFFGDHNTSMRKTNSFAKEFDFDNIQLHHVPFFIHAPKYLKPQTISRYTKLVDIMPTAAGLANINYTNYTLGSNVLDSTSMNGSFAFLYKSIKGEPGVAILKDSLYYTKATVSNTTSLYNLNSKSFIDIKQKHPIIAQQLDSLINGFYHGTKYLYYNNKKTK